MTEKWCSCNPLREAQEKAAKWDERLNAVTYIEGMDGVITAWCCPVKTAVNVAKDAGIKLESHHLFSLMNKCDKCDRTWNRRTE